MTKLHGSWIWYELITPDVSAAKAFYEAISGLRFAPGSPETGGYGFITAPDEAMVGGILPLTEAMTQHGARPCWLGYIGVDDVDRSVAAIVAAGGQELMPPRDVPMAGRIAMVSDCCGAPFYVMTPIVMDGGGESTAFSALRNPGHCGWNELMAGNAERALAFYTGLFGWSLPEAMDMGEMGKYQFVAHDGVTVGAVMNKFADMPQAAWGHYFWVPSVSAAKAAITTHGGQVINGPMEVPGEDWIIQGIDPQGAFFSLVGGQ